MRRGSFVVQQDVRQRAGDEIAVAVVAVPPEILAVGQRRLILMIARRLGQAVLERQRHIALERRDGLGMRPHDLRRIRFEEQMPRAFVGHGA